MICSPDPDVEDRIELARRLLTIVLRRAPTNAELRAHMLDEDADSLTDAPTEEARIVEVRH